RLIGNGCSSIRKKTSRP
ncbi:ubiquinol oxidase subunit 2 domain protein, partial [Vibrio parahaemolyticus V-223/04]